jgi:hypothetical protein
MATATAEKLTKFRYAPATRRELRLALASLDRAEIARRQHAIAQRRARVAMRRECEQLLAAKLAA